MAQQGEISNSGLQFVILIAEIMPEHSKILIMDDLDAADGHTRDVDYKLVDVLAYIQELSGP